MKRTRESGTGCDDIDTAAEAPLPKVARYADDGEEALAAPYGLPAELWVDEIIKRHLIHTGFRCRTLVALRRTCRWFAQHVTNKQLPTPGECRDQVYHAWLDESRAAIREWHRDRHVVRVLGMCHVRLGIPVVDLTKEFYTLAYEAVKSTKSADPLEFLYVPWKAWPLHWGQAPVATDRGREFFAIVAETDSVQLLQWYFFLHAVGPNISIVAHLLVLIQHNATACFAQLYQKEYPREPFQWQSSSQMLDELCRCSDHFLIAFIEQVHGGRLWIVHDASTATEDQVQRWLFPSGGYRIPVTPNHHVKLARQFMERVQRLLGAADDAHVRELREVATCHH